MKNIIFIFTVLLLFSCKAQSNLSKSPKSFIDSTYSIVQLDSAICLNKKYSEVSEQDEIIKKNLSRIRLKSANECGMNINEKGQIYIDEELEYFYRGVIIKDNNVCLINTYNSEKPNLLYQSKKIDTIENISVYINKMTLNKLKNIDIDLYYKYRVIKYGKLTQLNNCRESFNHTYFDYNYTSYYFLNDNFQMDFIPIDFNWIYKADKYEYMPLDDNSKEFINCVKKLNL